MPSLQITRFGGLRPGISERLLDQNSAQVAHNAKLQDGSLRAICAPLKVKDGDGSEPATVWQPQVVKDCPCPEIRCWPTCTYPTLPFDCEGFGWSVVFGDGEPYRMNVCTGEQCPLCMPQPENALTAELTDPGSVPVPDIPNYTGPDIRQYVYTWVDKFGVESAPSPPTCLTECSYDDAVWELSGFDAPPAHACEVRVYRTSSPADIESADSLDIEFVLVAVLDPGDTTFTDDICLADVEDGAMITEDYCCAPEGLACVQMTDLGYLVGFIGNELYFSESFEYANWPDRNRFELPDKIIGIAVYGDVVYVGTTGRPYRVLLARQVDQLTQEAGLAVDIKAYDMIAPLLSFRNIAASDSGAVIASKDGLYAMQGDQISNISRALIEDCDWLDYYPHSVEFFNGKLFASKWPTCSGWSLDLRNGPNGTPDFGGLVTLDYGPLAQSHGGTGNHLVSQEDGSVAIWDEAHEKLTYLWRSRKTTSQGLLGFAAAQVTADYGPPVQFRLYQDGELVADIEATDNQPFLLPLCGRGRCFEIELEGTTRVTEVRIATSIPELSENAPQ